MAEIGFRKRMTELEEPDDLFWARRMGFSFDQSGKKVAVAKLIAREATVDLVFAYDPWSKAGEGVGLSSTGNRYALRF